MKFEREKAKPIEPVSEKQLLRGLGYLHRPTSASRYAILSSDPGRYVQVGGAGMCCLLEWRDGEQGPHYRASQHPPVAPWPGITRHRVSSGYVDLRQEEFFRITQVEEAFVAFLRGEPFPAYIQWRDVTEEVAANSIPHE